MNQETGLRERVRRLISKASGLKHRRLHALLDELGLHRGQAWVLYALWDQDGLTQSELTERLNRSPSTVTKTVQWLEKAGFVKRCADDSDERVGNLRIDYVLPSKGMKITGCGVFWPAAGESGHELVEASDHRLVWIDILLAAN